MTKEQKSKKEEETKPSLNPKGKIAVEKSRRESRPFLGIEKIR